MLDTKLDIVIPIFNEIEIIDQLHERVVSACNLTGLNFRIIYVDDGSSDGTKAWIHENVIGRPDSSDSKAEGFGQSNLGQSNLGQNELSQKDLNASIVFDKTSTSKYSATLLELSRNFGQPSAILAGLRHSQSDCVVLMDGDLQDPPELIPAMVEQWQSGDQVVIAQRTSRKETFLRGLAFKAFHSCFRYLSDSQIPANTGTFCLLDRVAADSINELPESHRFFPGLRAWVGYRQSMLEFKRPPRAGGEPKQTFVRLLKYALDAVFGYSFKPLRLLTGVGLVICSLSFMLAGWFIFKRVAGWETASIGFTTLTCAVFGLGGFQLIGMGILGEYIGRIYDEVKARPQYIVSQQRHTDVHQTSTANSQSDTQPEKFPSRLAG